MPMPESVSQVLAALSEVTPHAAWDWFTGKPLNIVITVVAALILRWLALRSIGRVVATTIARSDARRAGEGTRAGRVLAQATGTAHERHRQRTLTMGSLLRSLVTFVVVLVTTLTVLATVGINLAPVLATAGVGGVALGFGAQSLVKDFLSGIFMILEDQYGVGDVVDTGEAIGTVEDVTLRVTRLRDGNGVVWYIRNGEIVRIGNRSQGWSTAIVDTAVAYDEDIDRAITVMRDVVHQMDQDPAWQGRLLEEPTVVGVESIAAGAVTVRIIAKCAPNENFPVQREIRERVKVALDRAGIRGPQLAPYGGSAPRA